MQKSKLKKAVGQRRTSRSYFWILGLLLIAALVITACGSSAEEEAPQESAAVEATEAPAEEEAEATEAPAEESEATAEPAEEAEATTEPEEEAEATAEPAEEAEATAEPEEEAAATAEPAEESEMMGDAEAGAYVFNITRGCGCHMNRDLGALAGGNKFEGPYGVLYSRNLTPHDETGIGSLSDEQIANSFRFGQRADGENLGPAMPHYATMSDKDAMDLVAYLRSLEPVENAVPDRELTIEVADFTPAEAPPAEAPSEGVERGEYIAGLASCAQCHTPRGEDGALNMELFLAGAPFRDTVAPNLTPDEGTGLGPWSEEEIADFLATGTYDDGTEAHGGMMSVVNGGTGKLTDDDRLAIAMYLKNLEPIDNLPEVAE